jgi:hypothetical protein
VNGETTLASAVDKASPTCAAFKDPQSLVPIHNQSPDKKNSYYNQVE